MQTRAMAAFRACPGLAHSPPDANPESGKTADACPARSAVAESGMPTTALECDGWTLLDPALPEKWLHAARTTCFTPGAAGTRCLLDDEMVHRIAIRLREGLAAQQVLPPDAVAIQAIAFDKTAATNWKVPWHQDLMFPFARPVTAPGYALSTRKDGIDYARPPLTVLQELLAVRLHLDDCDEENGPLRVAPGSHRHGLIPSDQVAERVHAHGETICPARCGEALLMKPLTLHASSRALRPGHRRVLHLVYHAGKPTAEEWHRSI